MPGKQRPASVNRRFCHRLRARKPPGSLGGFRSAARARSRSRAAEVPEAAVEAPLLVIELSGPTMMARIGVMRALNRNVERVFTRSRKDPHWGKRKLARDR